MAKLQELFSDLFTYVLLFEQMGLQGGRQPAYEAVRNEIATLLQRQEAAAKRQGVLEQDYHSARFAVLAWADETILKYAAWEHHSRWNAFPLQLEYYQTRNAGEELFERLERLRADQQEIREIYYLCLGLGFSGRYFLGMEDERKLNQIRHEQAQHLALPVEDIQEMRRLTPQPYDVAPAPGKPITEPWTRHLFKGGVAVLIGVPLLLFLVYLFSSPPPPTGEVRQEARRRPPFDLQAAVRQWLAQHPESTRCSKLQVDVVDVKAGSVRLGGRVASEAQQVEIRQGLQSIKGVAQVNDTTQIIPRPFCEVVELLEPLKEYTETQRVGVLMQLNKQEARPVYRRGENLLVSIQTPAAFDSYLYVDYYTADQQVVHVFPNPAQSTNVMKPGASFTIGDLTGPLPWRISPPFGLELVTVMASKTPLFLPPRVDPEPAQAYLDMLRQALDRGSQAEVSATFSFITTQD
jgi:type VI secretion system protein ImpK